jgi:hypothetical protein
MYCLQCIMPFIDLKHINIQMNKNLKTLQKLEYRSVYVYVYPSSRCKARAWLSL